MEVVLWQILQWILRIILFLLLLIIVIVAIILIVPVRYKAEGSFLEKKPDIKGKITWFFYLIYMKFCYEDEFRMQVRVLGFKVFDSTESGTKLKKKTTKKQVRKTEVSESEKETSGLEESTIKNIVNEVDETNVDNKIKEDERNTIKSVQGNGQEDELAAWEREIDAQAKEEAELAKKMIVKSEVKAGQSCLQDDEERQNCLKQDKLDNPEEKKSFSEKIYDIKYKIGDVIQKIKDIIAKMKAGKLKVEHYLELWNKNETQITFHRAKIKLGKMIKAILPRNWSITGEVGFDNPATTGQFMGVLGAMYPLLANKVQIVPNFDNQVIAIKGNVKGHIRLGNLLYQLVSLLLNRHCFKFIKLVFDELGSSSKGDKKQKV